MMESELLLFSEVLSMLIPPHILNTFYKLKMKRHERMYHSKELENMELEIIQNMKENKFLIFSNKVKED